jgi:PAS domain S-box-containing protein
MLTPLQFPYFFDSHYDLWGWGTWVVLFILIIFGVGRSLETNINWGKREWILLSVLLGAVFITTHFMGVSLPVSGGLPRPERPDFPSDLPLMFFIALPWLLAGGWLGVLPATLLGAISGFLLGYLGTHSPFTPLEMALMALIASLMMRQKYRTLFYKFLRHPLGTAVILIGCFSLLSLVSLTVTTSGPLVSRLDYALTHLETSILAFSVEIIIAGLIVEVFALSKPRWWGRQELPVYAPSETRLQVRFFTGVAPWMFILIIIVMIGDWVVSERAARQTLQTQLASTAKVAAEAIPFFLETGQNLIAKFAVDKQLQVMRSANPRPVLQELLSSVPFFRQLCIVDKNGNFVAGYPTDELLSLNQTADERLGIKLALKGVQVQIYSVPPLRGDKTAQVAFIAAIPSTNNDEITGVLWGRADLDSNPFTQPVIKALDGVASSGGEGQIIDENRKILYNPTAVRVMEEYQGQVYTEPKFYDEAGTSGLRQWVYFQPTIGRSWGIILTVPARQVQQMALNTAVPLFILILLFAGIAYLFWFLVLRKVTGSLVTLADEAEMIAQGQLEHTLPATRDVDEVGQLSKAFEQMRVGLKARLDELNRLLVVSQGVASSLEIGDAIQPILKAALSSGACLARVVLVEDTVSDLFSHSNNRFSQGPASESFIYLDVEILNLARQRGNFVLNNLSRGRGLNIPSNVQRPASLSAIALRHENQFYGVLWVGYAEVHPFNDEETRFLSTLGAQAALAAANSRLYASAEIGRQQLEAVLASTPDPVLVTDQQNRLLIANPAFLQLPVLAETSAKGQPIQDVISQKDLLNSINQSIDGEPSREIKLANGKTYFVTISSVKVDQHSVGKICVLRDITHYKELDTLKSEFVSTVSHDLRSPLTLMRGYATMLPLVGELNEQQKNFVRRIVGGIENMSRLVSNLLDLGRIEAGVGLKLEKIAPAEVLERVTGLLQLQAAQKNIQFEVALPEKQNPIITADAALLQQALYNLVENAIKYTPINGQVKVNMQMRADTVLFSIRDNGVGVAPLDQPRLFEKFYRGGQREGQETRGSGLGLAIVKLIAEKHGGKVWLESQLGKGSTFYLEIPLNTQPIPTEPLSN